MRGQARDYDGWRSLGNAGWGWDDVLPVFKRSEDYHLGADALHGAGGEWRVEQQRLSWEILDAFRDAMGEAGIPKIGDFNRGDNEGSGLFEVNQKRGVRWNASKAFLRPAMRRPNLTVLTNSQVRRLRLAGRRAAGVEFSQGGEETFAAARVETVLAAGSIGSPQILQLSGIGPATLLREHGIAVAHELKRSEERRVGKEGRSGRSSWSEGRKTEWRGVSEGAGWAHSEGGVRWGRW